MKKVIFAVVLVVMFVADLIFGRPILNGLDSLIPRKVTALPKPFLVEVRMSDGRRIKREIHCENYYDTENGVGGNFWAIRERGMVGLHDPSRVAVAIDGVGTVNFVMPTCTDLASGAEIRVGHMLLLINGAIYGHARSEGSTHTYIPRIAHQGDNVTLEFEVYVDGKKLR